MRIQIDLVPDIINSTSSFLIVLVVREPNSSFIQQFTTTQELEGVSYEELPMTMTNQQGVKYFYSLTRYLNVPFSYGIITVDIFLGY